MRLLPSLSDPKQRRALHELKARLEKREKHSSKDHTVSTSKVDPNTKQKD